MEELKEKSKAIDIFIDMMSKTGDINFILMKNYRNLNKKLQMINLTLDDEIAKKANNLFLQIENIIDDFIKENNIKEDK